MPKYLRAAARPPVTAANRRWTPSRGPPPRRTRMPPVGPRMSPSATTWSVRPPGRGAAELRRNGRLSECPRQARVASHDPIEPSNSSLASSDQWAARSHQPIGNGWS